MFESSINVKLKSIFDKMYLSRNLFDKMKDLISTVEEGSHGYNQLIQRSNSILNTINDVTNNIEGFVEYNNYISQLIVKNDQYTDHCNSIVLEMLEYYENVIDKLITDVEGIRISTSNSDRLYTSLPGSTIVGYEPPFSNSKMTNFIPTDDVFSWNSMRKGENLATNKLFISTKSYKKIDPLEEGGAYTYSGNDKSSILSHPPTIFDTVINVKGGGFSLDSINSKTGERYSRIEDDYSANISVDTNREYNQSVKEVFNNNILSSPKQGLNLKIEEIRPFEVLIRRHSESEPGVATKIYANIHDGTIKEG